MKYLIIFFLISVFALDTRASEVNKRAVYQYKKYEKIDLGSLEIQGELVAPGDLNVQERDRNRIELDLYERRNAVDFSEQDLSQLH
jgi:hypothetical protein